MRSTTYAVPEIDLAAELLQLSSLPAQAALLQAHASLNAAGLSHLLDQATNLTRKDPGQAYRLAGRCAELASDAGSADAVPRAHYIQAQACAIQGQLAQARQFVQLAHDGYLALDEPLKALRTNVGLMHVLNEQGRHREVLVMGRQILDRLAETGANDPCFQGLEAQLVAILTHNNLGVCYRRMGRYAEALAAYAAAEAECLAGGITDRLGDIRNNRGLILLHLGRVNEALAAFTDAAAARAEAGLVYAHAESLVNVGEAHLSLGNYTQSLEVLATAEALFHSLDSSANEHFIWLHRADVYLALNLYPEALIAYQDAGRAFQVTGMNYYQARALWGAGAALAALKQFAAAADQLQQAALLFEAAGNVPLACSVMLETAALQQARGESDQALAMAQAALARVAGDQWPVQQLYAHLRLADWLPEDDQVEAHLRQAQALSDALELPYLRYRLQQRWGQLRRRQGRFQEARTWLETAVREIERLRGNLAQEAMRLSFLHDKITTYEELLRLHLSQNDVFSAFAVAEQAKSRTLAELQAGVINQFRTAGSTPAARRRQLQAELNAIYNSFLNSPEALPDLRRRARILEQEINRLELQTNGLPVSRDPFAAVLPPDQIQAHLPPDLILLAYHVVGNEIIAFGYADEMRMMRQVSDVAAVQSLLQRLHHQCSRFQVGKPFVQRHMAQLEQSTRRILAELYQALIAPLAGWLSQDHRRALAIVPHGILHQVPFHALYDGRAYLLEAHEISYAPSATVLAQCQQVQPRPDGHALLMGVADHLIPGVEAEVTAVSRQVGSEKLFAGPEATLAAFQQHAAGARLIHLACHGLFRTDNPMFSALKLHDGWLTAADVAALDLRGALVTLSACESGRHQVLAGDELVGLTRSFLGAGAVTLVASLWLVQDETTAVLMADWYRRLQANSGLKRAAALREAQLALMATHPHPYYWAPFVLIGWS